MGKRDADTTAESSAPKRQSVDSDQSDDSDSLSLSSLDSGANDDPSIPELVATAKEVIAKMQTAGENILMNLLVKREGPREATVARILEVLFLLDVAKVEEHRGRDARPSRAYTYRTGYALPAPVPVAEIRSRIARAKAAQQQAATHENDVDSSPTGDAAADSQVIY